MKKVEIHFVDNITIIIMCMFADIIKIKLNNFEFQNNMQ